MCESKITHIDYGDVEHFRPKKAFCQSNEENLTRPGYFWLAYRWDNLFLACTLCNRRHKRNLFPLGHGGVRAISPFADLSEEKPLFINPADPDEDDPETLISFRVDELSGVIPYAVENNPKGEATIKGGRLDRAKLCQRRMALLKPILALYKVAVLNMSQPESEEANSILQSILEDVTSDSAEYAGMFRAAVRTNFELS